jgi:hypothetical protein
MNTHNTRQHATHERAEKKVYVTPSITAQGRVEDLTQWIGGRWGEFFNGQGSGWNPWKSPGGS